MKKEFQKLILASMVAVLSSSCGVQDGPSLLSSSSPSGGNGGSSFLLQLGSVTKVTGGDNSAYDNCTGVAVDNLGNVYCAGNTGGGIGEANGGNDDAFVMKVNSSGKLQWVTQLGNVTKAAGGDNSGDDFCVGVAVDSSGNVYCAGYTSGAMSEANGGGDDAFVMKLNSSGQIQWVTQLGAVTKAVGGNNSGTDHCEGVALDSSGNVFCAGYTTGAMGEANGGGAYDAFVMKLNNAGQLQWVTQLGAVTKDFLNVGEEQCHGVAVDSTGNVYCAGHTLGIIGEAQGGSYDAFILKLNNAGALQWVTQLGAVTKAPGANNAGDDKCYGVAVDSVGNVFCGGGTTGGIMGEASGGGADAFVVKLDSTGALQWVTQFGAVTKATGGSNSGSDYCYGVAVDSLNNVYCAGETWSSMGEANGGSTDVMVTKLNSSGALQWLTQLGAVTKATGGDSSQNDACRGVAVATSGKVSCAGGTSSLGEPNAGSHDAFILNLTSEGRLSLY